MLESPRWRASCARRFGIASLAVVTANPELSTVKFVIAELAISSFEERPILT